jgi:peptidoglycan L-alanyl-D-glutamate endopeptidase CwlK
MPEFGRKSEKMLEGVDARLVKVCRRAIKVMDFMVVDGVRTIEEQRINVARGLSQTMNSKHLDGLAVDLAPWPLDFADTEMFCVLAGVMMACAAQENLRLRWGGDWNSDRSTRDERFRDYGHFEILK